VRQYRVPQVRQAIVSERVVTAEGLRPACIVFEDGRIVALENRSVELGATPVLDFGNLCVLPGLVDSHVHINAPGRSEWEGFETASRAAAAAGFTCLVDMPLNSIPATTSIPALEEKRKAANGICMVDYAFWGGAVSGNTKDLLPLAGAGVKGFKCFLVHPGIEEFSMLDEQHLRVAMPLIAKSRLPLLVHAEDPGVIAKAHALINGDPRRYATYLQSRPDEAETHAIELLTRLCREYGCRVHIVHLSSALALPLIRRAREEALPLTVETCPHYLYFEAEGISDGATQLKCAPPIRQASNRDLLWEALREGVIDLIATDHSPCPPEMKRMQDGDFLRAWGGIASLSVAFSAIWTAASRRGFEITDVVRWMGEKTADLAGLGSKKGRISPGYDADFVVFDPDESFVVQTSDLHFRHTISCYVGEQLKGRVKTTFLRGTPIFDHGKFADSRRGNECRVSEWTTAS
jgi:allantoinase